MILDVVNQTDSNNQKVKKLEEDLNSSKESLKMKSLEIDVLKSSALSNSSNSSNYLSQVNSLKSEIERYKDLLANKDLQINNLIIENGKLQDSLKAKEVRDILVSNNLKLELQNCEKEIKNLKDQNEDLKEDKNFFKTLIENKKSFSKNSSVKSKFSEDEIDISNIVSNVNTVFSQSLKDISTQTLDNVEIKKPVNYAEQIIDSQVDLIGSEYIIIN